MRPLLPPPLERPLLRSRGQSTRQVREGSSEPKPSSTPANRARGAHNEELHGLGSYRYPVLPGKPCANQRPFIIVGTFLIPATHPSNPQSHHPATCQPPTPFPLRFLPFPPTRSHLARLDIRTFHHSPTVNHSSHLVLHSHQARSFALATFATSTSTLPIVPKSKSLRAEDYSFHSSHLARSPVDLVSLYNLQHTRAPIHFAITCHWKSTVEQWAQQLLSVQTAARRASLHDRLCARLVRRNTPRTLPL